MGIATTSEPLPDPPRSDPLLSLVFNTQLLPPGFVRVAAAIFSPFYRPPVIALMLCLFVAVDVWLVVSGGIDAAFHRSVGDPVLVLTLMVLWVCATLFHEFGHAAGCHYGGARPGGIGVGILVLYPAFYTNVTDAYRLDRRGRLRTDLGGIYFNAIFIVAVFGLYQLTEIPALKVFMVLNHLQILQQLLPLLRLDGYLILGDLVGVPNLFAFVGPVWRRLRGKPDDGSTMHQALRPRVQVLVTTWVLIVVPLLIVALTLLLVRLPFYLATATSKAVEYGEVALAAGGQGSVGILLLAVLSMLLLLIPWVGGTAFAIRTGRRVVKLVRKLRARRRASRPQPKHRKRSGRLRPPPAAA
jgi:putative peptide zinc metalloprotease protein